MQFEEELAMSREEKEKEKSYMFVQENKWGHQDLEDRLRPPLSPV